MGHLKLLLIGVLMVPMGLLMVWMALGDEPIYPAGLYSGPLIIILGIVLAVISGRNLGGPNDGTE